MKSDDLLSRLNKATGFYFNDNDNDDNDKKKLNTVKSNTDLINTSYTEEQALDFYQLANKADEKENASNVIDITSMTAIKTKTANIQTTIKSGEINVESANIPKTEIKEQKKAVAKPLEVTNRTETEINAQEQAIQRELSKNEKHLATLQMLKEIVEKKDYDLLNMTDKEKLEALILKSKGLM